MIIEQDKMDDAVLQLRIRQLLKYVGALLHDRPRREMPSDLRQVKDLVDKLAAEPLFAMCASDQRDLLVALDMLIRRNYLTSVRGVE